MNLKAFIGVFAVALLVLAAVPGSTHAEVADPTSGNLIPNLREKYGIECGDGIKCDESLTRYLVEEKDESDLTWKESYLLMRVYSITVPGDSHPLNIDKAKHYGDLMLQKEDTKDTRALYYGELESAYWNKYKETNDPSFIQESIKFHLKHLEANPDGVTKYKGVEQEGTAWGGLDWSIEKLRTHGYDVPEGVLNFSDRIEKSGKWKELETKEDLKEIGYYDWKNEEIMPIVEQDEPTSTKLADVLPVDRDSTIGTIFNTILVKYVLYGVGGLFAVAIMVFGAIRVKNQAKARRRRRY